MYVDADTSSKRKQRFLDNQASHVKPVLDPAAPYVDYTADSILAMFRYWVNLQAGGEYADGVRIYFAVYDNDISVPEELQGKFTHVFSLAKQRGPTDRHFDDLGKYFNLFPKGSFTPGTSDIPESRASNWVKRWQQNILVNIPVDTSLASNRDENGNYSDTRSIIYTIADLTGMMAEIECEGASGVRVYLASFRPGEGQWPDRMTTLFELLDANGNEIIISELNREQQQRGLDTGNPCPPALGCSGSNLPTP